MADNAGIPSENAEDSLFDVEAKFDPSDYLPRRTSRTSAHAASKAIKKSLKEEKTISGKKNIHSEEAEEQKNDSSHVGKVKSSVKAKRRQHTRTPYDCQIKLVPCEKDPAQKKWMQSVEKRYKKPESEYKVFYAPAACCRVLPPQANGTLLPQKAENPSVNIGAKPRKSGYLDGSRLPPTSSKPSSLNVVVVHPKPGSKIINRTKTRETKSARLNELISNPDVVISPEVSRIMTTGGNAELRCNKCSKTYKMARDLMNHKRLVHKASHPMCTTCAEEFPTEEKLSKHECKVKNQCDICGAVCRSILAHKQKAHPKTLGNYMCQVCCFNAGSQEELNAHVCGGRPKIKYSARASSAVLVYPPVDSRPKGTVSKPQPNIYVDIGEAKMPAASDVTVEDTGSRSSPMQFLCEVCLNMYPSSAALASHKCDTTIVVDPDPSPEPSSSTSVPSSSLPTLPTVVPPPPSMAMPGPMLPLGMEVMPEIEQLAKFYSSVVFKE